MLRWSIAFLIIAIIAAIFGYTGIAQQATAISKTIFFIFLGLWVISLGISLMKP